MGLSVTEHLVKQGWNVAIVDFNEEIVHKVADRLRRTSNFCHGRCHRLRVTSQDLP